MNITKPDALFMYVALSNYSVRENMSLDEQEHLASLLSHLRVFLLVEDKNDSDDVVYTKSSERDDVSSEEEEDSEEEYCDPEDDKDEEAPTNDDTVPISKLIGLPTIDVIDDRSGKTITFAFDTDDSGSLIAVLDCANESIDNIMTVLLTTTSIEVWDSDNWHHFKIKKIPHAWSRFLWIGVLYGPVEKKVRRR